MKDDAGLYTFKYLTLLGKFWAILLIAAYWGSLALMLVAAIGFLVDPL